MNNAVPFLDLISPHLELEEELIVVFRDALKTGRFIGGPMVEDFERDFAVFCGTKYCIGVGSGTDALRFALIAAGVQKGDIVITVPNTFIATTEDISQSGAAPAFVDIDERTYNMDHEKLRQSASLYNKLLSHVDGVITPYEPDWSRAVYHLYVIRAKNREELQKHLTEKKIGTGLHYPLPLHLQKAYEYLGYKEGDFPVSEKVATELLSLPMYPGLTESQQEYVVECLRDLQ